MPMLSEDRRREIATFLKNRRARLQPEHVGLPRGKRRRTPGLRREEVAASAGISTEWYTWLEQARDVRPSAETLRRIAAALRLDPAESRHLFALGGHGADGSESTAVRDTDANPRFQRLLDQLDSCPAWVCGERWDFLAWNRAATIIHGDIATLEGVERNGLYRLFLSPRMRAMLVDWEVHARDCVAKLRLAHARHVDDPWFNELVHALRARSPEFAAWWDDHNVQLPQHGVKIYDHPEAGRLEFDYVTLALAGGHGTMVTYVPADGTDTRRKMAHQLVKRLDAGPQ